MKPLLFIIICCSCLQARAQETNKAFDGKNWEAPYFLDKPAGWEIERFLVPIAFAPSIQYKGVEDIRFTHGWAKKESNEYWSYAFLWYLDSLQTFDPATIEKNLVAYYTGLANVNVDRSKVDLDKILKVHASIKQRRSGTPGTQVFEGSVQMLDYMTLKPLTVNLIIHVRYCEKQNKTIVFHEISPRPYSDSVWKSLDQLWTGFRCTKD